jgi:hypothetical protein
MDTFWINNPYIIVKDYYEIIPTNSMDRIRQMNTISRFLIYFLILCILFNSGENFILFGLIALMLVIAFYFIYRTDPIGVQNDLINENTEEIEQFDKLNCINCENNNKNILDKALIKIYDEQKDQVLKGTAKFDKDLIIESGYIDADGNYKIGKDYSDINIEEWQKEQEKSKKKISFEKNELYINDNSRKPTVDNPFTNIVFSDYLDASNIAEPCNTDDKNVQQDMQNLYNSTIYRNIQDVFERENSQRMFYTVPIRTVPNDQTEFANWLYKTGPTCKENSQNCTYYEIPTMSSQRY